ncbi:MAG TPA: YafY family protein [Nocardioidaceae bacterium]|nr:YafY family protein [Nocardioidaceae bacterium]
MADSRSRMLRLLSLLQTHRYWTGPELAERLEVSPRTLRRDVDRLRDLGYPVSANRGVAGGYQLQAGAALPPLLLEDDEAVAIAVSLSAAAGGIVSGVEETSVQALGKIVQVMPPKLRRRVKALQEYTVPAVLPGPTVDATMLATLAQACRDDERLQFRYTARGGEPELRLVEPHRLVTLGRRWYLVAYDLRRHDWRTFRIDRLSDPHVTGVRFRPRELPAADAAAFVRQGIESARTHIEVEVRVEAPAGEVAKVAARWAEVTPVGAESCRIRMDVDTLDWPILLLGAIDAEFEVLAPPELAERVRRVGERFSRAQEAAAPGRRAGRGTTGRRT